MEPPPAPISTISTTGIFTGSPLPFMKRWARSISKARDSRGSPSSIRQILAVVPPMSKDSTRSSPSSRAIAEAKTAPPAGPDSTRRMGWPAAVAMVTRLPPDVMSRQGQAKPRAASRASRSAR